MSKVVGKPFTKGRSGNPGGRPRTKWLREKVEEWTPRLADVLFKIATSSKSEDRRIAAIELLWARAFGKPAVNVDVAGEIEHQHFVIRAPAMLPSASAWEAAHRPAIDVEATVVSPAPPPDPEPLPENPPVPGNARPGPHALEGSPLDRPLDLRDPAWRPGWWADRTAAEASTPVATGSVEHFRRDDYLIRDEHGEPVHSLKIDRGA